MVSIPIKAQDPEHLPKYMLCTREDQHRHVLILRVYSDSYIGKSSTELAYDILRLMGGN